MLDPYGSHMSVLIRHALEADSILELGMGWYSTPMLSEIAEGNGTDFMSIETDREWYENFIYLQSPMMQIESWDLLEGMEELEAAIRDPFDLIFLDNSELVVQRYKRWPYLSTICKKLIMHDANHIPPVVSECFKYHKVYTEMPGPPTIVASHYPI